MATAFSDLYPLVRTILADNDPQRIMYSDGVIDSQIRLRILTDNDLNVQESGSTKIFTTDLTPTQKALIILQVAKAIIVPLSNEFSYRNPVHSVSRKGGVLQLLSNLDEQISELENSNGKLIRFDTEISAILNGALRFYGDYSNALVVDGQH